MQIVFDMGGKLRVSPPLWPHGTLQTQPGDLTQFAPQGNGVYGYQEGIENPMLAAPPQEDIGGALYFGNGILKEDFQALMRILNVGDDYDYAVFTSESSQPGQDGYLRQLRLVSKFALRFMFGALASGEYETFPLQQLSMPEAFWGFIEHEWNDWGTSFRSSKLAGKFGGDGDFAREELSFGFMVENDYHRVYRVWSRAWLVTK